MNKYKISAVGLVVAILGVVFMGRALAADLTVTCANHANPCTTTPGGSAPLFEEDNLLPGDTVQRTITVTNEDESEICSLSLLNLYNQTQNPSDFAAKLFTVIRSGADLYGSYLGGEVTPAKSLNDLFGDTPVDLSVDIPPGGTEVFDWIVTFDINAGNAYQKAETIFDFELLFACSLEEEEEARLTLTKTNDTSGGSRSPGSSVLFTLVVTNGNAPLENVEVTDLPHDGFVYRSGSWTSSKPGVPEPVYASPGIWYLGDLSPGEVVTLTYIADINGNQEPGLYPDLAWAQGTLGGSQVLANNDTGVFVGTKVWVDTGLESAASYELPAVLGTSTELPATGANTFWLILAGSMFILGLGILSLGVKNKKE